VYVVQVPHNGVVETTEQLHARLATIISQSHVMIFIKGTPDAPRCGFSRQIVEILRSTVPPVDFGHFNILEDDAVRQGLKTFSQWPTFPQLYVGGKLVGGLDICKELASSGEFSEALQ
jgi:Grx4 family monothiol glutaredoxin